MGERKRLPDRRQSWVQKAKVGGQTIYVTHGEYEDGSLGEVFIDVNKAGSAFRGLMDGMARLFSVALQHGVPLAALVQAIKGLNFAPLGPVDGSENVTHATSLLDYVAKELEATYLKAEQPE